jgi:MFS family permease
VTDRPASVVRNPDFVRLWTGETISQFGSQVSTLAIPLIAATLLKVTPFEFGLLGTIEFLPFILLSLPAGVWVDRLPRRPILILGDLGRAAALISIPIAFELGVLTIWQLYVVGFLVGCLTVFFDVAYQSYLPALVERDQLVEGNSKLEISRSAAAVVGPGLTGVVIGVIGAAVAVVLDVLSFLLSAFFVFRIRKVEPDPRLTAGGERIERGPGMRHEVSEGLRFVLGNRYLRSIAACTGTTNLFFNISGAILILYAIQELGLGPAAIGFVFSIGALGFLAGAVIANRVAARFGVGRTIVGAAFLGFPAAVLIAAAPPGLEIPFFIAAFILEGLCQSIYNINQVSFRQAITPTRMQGRMNATMRFIVWGTIPIGALLGGTLGGLIGLHETIWVAAVGSFLPFLFVLFSPVRTITTMPAPVDDAATPVGDAAPVDHLMGPPSELA